MWWNSIFGTKRYAWVCKKAEKVRMFNKDRDKINLILRKILMTWDPTVDDAVLEPLLSTVKMIARNHSWYPMDTICGCVSKIDFNKDSFVAWDIINELLRTRIEKFPENMDKQKYFLLCTLSEQSAILLNKIKSTDTSESQLMLNYKKNCFT